MSHRRWMSVLVIALVLLVLVPDLAHACPVCFDQKEKNRLAFFTTTIFLSGLPLGIIAAMTWYIRRKAAAVADQLMTPPPSTISPR